MTLTIEFDEAPSASNKQRLLDGLREHAQQKKQMDPIEFFAFWVKDNNNEIVGGCTGDILYGCCYVDSLWISESLRHQGYGTTLMKNAETYAMQKHCNFIAVNTMDWEALDFYKKLGFYVELKRHGFAKKSVFYLLRKDLK